MNQAGMKWTRILRIVSLIVFRKQMAIQLSKWPEIASFKLSKERYILAKTRKFLKILWNFVTECGSLINFGHYCRSDPSILYLVSNYSDNKINRAIHCSWKWQLHPGFGGRVRREKFCSPHRRNWELINLFEIFWAFYVKTKIRVVW